MNAWQEEQTAIQEEAERLAGYWEQHGETPEVVAKWAVSDLLDFVRQIVEVPA
jgi:hypothetical protein